MIKKTDQFVNNPCSLACSFFIRNRELEQFLKSSIPRALASVLRLVMSSGAFPVQHSGNTVPFDERQTRDPKQHKT